MTRPPTSLRWSLVILVRLCKIPLSSNDSKANLLFPFHRNQGPAPLNQLYSQAPQTLSNVPVPLGIETMIRKIKHGLVRGNSIRGKVEYDKALLLALAMDDHEDCPHCVWPWGLGRTHHIRLMLAHRVDLPKEAPGALHRPPIITQGPPSVDNIHLLRRIKSTPSLPNWSF